MTKKTRNSHSKFPMFELLAGDIRDLLLIKDHGVDGSKLERLLKNYGAPEPFPRESGGQYRWPTTAFMNWFEASEFYETWLESRNQIEDEPSVLQECKAAQTLRQRVQETKETKSKRVQFLVKPSTYERLWCAAEDLEISVTKAIETGIELFLDKYETESKQ